MTYELMPWLKYEDMVISDTYVDRVISLGFYGFFNIILLVGALLIKAGLLYTAYRFILYVGGYKDVEYMSENREK